MGRNKETKTAFRDKNSSKSNKQFKQLKIDLRLQLLNGKTDPKGINAGQSERQCDA